MKSNYTESQLREQIARASGADKVELLANLSELLSAGNLPEAQTVANEAVGRGRSLIAEARAAVSDAAAAGRALALALKAQAHCSILSFQVERTISIGQEAQALLLDLEEWQLQAELMIMTASAYRYSERNEKALEQLQQALQICQRHDLTKPSATIYAEMAIIYQREGNIEQAQQALRRARALGDLFNMEEEQHSLFLLIAHVHAELAEFEEARQLFERIMPQFRKHANKYHLLAALHNYGIILLALNRHQQALQLAEERISIAQEAGLTHIEANSWKQIGELYMQYGEYDRASGALTRALATFRKLDKQHLVLSVMANLGRSYCESGDRERGMAYLRETSERLFQLPRNIEHFNAVGILVEYTPENCRPEDLVAYLLEEKKRTYNAGSSTPVRIRLLLGQLYENLGSLQAAQQELSEALALGRTFDNLCLQAEALASIGALESRIGDYEAARQHLRSALFLAGDCHSWTIRRQVHKALLDHFENLQDFRSALDQFKELQRLEHEVLFEQTNRRVDRLLVESDLDRLEDQHAVLTNTITSLESELALLRRSQQDYELQEQLGEKTTVGLKRCLRDAMEGPEKEIQEKLSAALTLLEDKKGGEQSALSGGVQESLDKEFIAFLKQQYPKLTKQELKVCSLVRMKMSTKDLARLMSVSPRAVETYRYRIRQKLELEPGSDLVAAIERIAQDM